MIVDVSRGSSIAALAEQLSPLVTPMTFRLYGRLTDGSGPIIAGRYEVPEGASLRSLFAQFRAGDVVSYPITFPEGLTFREWRATMAKTEGLVASEATDDELLAQLNFASGEGEGYFFPDTYQFHYADHEIDILQRARARMDRVLEQEWANRRHDILANAADTLILASIIEKETGSAQDRNLIARVFLNRLEINMKLQSDPTVIYGLGQDFDGDLRRRDLRNPHPYNTYVHNGLPPTPICMPGLQSIRAALQAPASPYFYFVARGDGSSYFSVTLDEHNQAVNQFQRNRGQKGQ